MWATFLPDFSWACGALGNWDIPTTAPVTSRMARIVFFMASPWCGDRGGHRSIRRSAVRQEAERSAGDFRDDAAGDLVGGAQRGGAGLHLALVEVLAGGRGRQPGYGQGEGQEAHEFASLLLLAF